jgi:hypothetical protein
MAPFTAGADSGMMPADDQIQPGIMENGQADPEELAGTEAGTETIQAQILEFEGDLLVAKAEDGQQLVFLVDDTIGQDNLAVGDKLELRLDHEAGRAVIVNVLPQNEERSL